MRAMDFPLLATASLLAGALLNLFALQASAFTVVGFYDKSCPRAEDIILGVVQKRFLVDRTITPALLRMLFHDSFVRGADASILLDSTPGHPAEKEALPNLTIRGFDLIDAAKEATESVCPGVVSCADIIVIAVRDSVALAGGPRYEVPTGRLDGKVSVKDEALNLPSPAFPVEQSRESFREKGLDVEDMVALLGAHTVGVALCGFFNDRLFNFHGTGAADPSMNPQLVTRLSAVCPNPFFTESNADPPVNLDQATPAIFDTFYYREILAGNGILQIDQEITADPSTSGFVQNFTSPGAFFPAFIQSINKMGNIGVLTGTTPLGEVRRKCNVINSQARTTPAGTKPPPVAGHSTKPPPASHAHTSKPPHAGHSSKPPPSTGHSTKPAPVIHGHTSKPPTAAGHSAKPPPPASHSIKTPPAIHAHFTKPPPAGRSAKRPPRHSHPHN